MSAPRTLASLSAPRKLLLTSGLLLLLDSFLPWYTFDPFIGDVTHNGWHQLLGVLVWLALIATLAWEGIRIAGRAPVDGARADLVTVAAAGLTILLGAIFILVRLFDEYLGVGFWLGLLLFIVFGLATIQLFLASDEPRVD